MDILATPECTPDKRWRAAHVGGEGIQRRWDWDWSTIRLSEPPGLKYGVHYYYLLKRLKH